MLSDARKSHNAARQLRGLRSSSSSYARRLAVCRYCTTYFSVVRSLVFGLFCYPYQWTKSFSTGTVVSVFDHVNDANLGRCQPVCSLSPDGSFTPLCTKTYALLQFFVHIPKLLVWLVPNNRTRFVLPRIRFPSPISFRDSLLYWTDHFYLQPAVRHFTSFILVFLAFAVPGTHPSPYLPDSTPSNNPSVGLKSIGWPKLATDLQRIRAAQPLATAVPNVTANTRKIPPLAFILTVVIVVLLLLLLLLTFWWLHKRNTRSTSQLVSTRRNSSASVDQKSCQPDPHKSSSKILTTGPQSEPNPQLQPRKATHWFNPCFACCPPCQPTTPPDHHHHNNNNTDDRNTFTEFTETKTDSPLHSTVIDSAKSFRRSAAGAAAATVVRKTSSDGSCSEISCSPSLASRRHVAPLPKLVTASILSPYPPIETSLFNVQPTKASCPTESFVSDRTEPKSNRVESSHGPSRSNDPEFGLIKLPLSSVRTRTKGLLESRRGSHTSLTLSLSPLIATTGASVDSCEPAHSNMRGVSLDECGLHANIDPGDNADTLPVPVCPRGDYCHSARSTLSDGQAPDYLVPSPVSQSPLVLGTPTLHVTHASCPSAKLLTADCARSEHGDLMPAPRHQALYRRLHGHPTHHRCVEAGQPCPHMAHSYQRSRDLEQLITASHPLTYDQLVHKLRDNSSALFQEFWNIPMNHTSKKELPIAGIGQKNRYQSILPNYATRVVLPMINDDPITTYINANYVRGYGDHANAFIATQGPMSHTIVDFWRMVWYCNSPAIVMITKLVEKQGVKCELYLPNTPPDETTHSMMQTAPMPCFAAEGAKPSSTSATDSPSSHGSQSVPHSSPSQCAVSPGEDSGIASHEDQSVDATDLKSAPPLTATGLDPSDLVALPTCAQTFGDIHVTVVNVERFEGYSVRQLVLRRNSEERVVFHFWYTAWPDHSSPETTPSSSRQLLRLVKAVESCRRKPPDPGEQSGNGSGECSTVTPSGSAPVGDSTSLGATAAIQSFHPIDPSPSDGPIVVHCSAGLGRTGCFIALCVGCAQLEREGVVDVLRIVSRLRLDRGGMVQTNEQYEFIHHALTAFPSIHSPTVCDRH